MPFVLNIVRKCHIMNVNKRPCQTVPDSRRRPVSARGQPRRSRGELARAASRGEPGGGEGGGEGATGRGASRWRQAVAFHFSNVGSKNNTDVGNYPQCA